MLWGKILNITPTQPSTLQVASAIKAFCAGERHRAEYALRAGGFYPGRAPPASGQETLTNPILT